MVNDFEILFEDEFLVAINKPYGVVVNRAVSVKGLTVQDWMQERYGKIFSSMPDTYKTLDRERLRQNEDWDMLNRIAFYERHGIVHRLDKETSGVLILAKHEDAFINLLKQFKDRETEKVYIALVHGILKEKEGVIEAPVGRLPWNRERFGVLEGGRAAVTRFEVLQEFQQVSVQGMKDKEDFSLVRLFPKTGRTHQLRIHLKHLGHPIVGDSFYAGRKTARNDRKWCGRLMLHAEELSLTHPEFNKAVQFTAELPEQFEI